MKHSLAGFCIVKVKCTLVQALRLCTGRTAHRGSRGITILFHDQRHQKWVRGQRHAPAALYPRERPGTHCIGGWVGPRAGLDKCGKSRPPTGIRSSDRPAPQPVAIPTEPTLLRSAYDKYRENYTVAVTELGDFGCFFSGFVLSLPPVYLTL